MRQPGVREDRGRDIRSTAQWCRAPRATTWRGCVAAVGAMRCDTSTVGARRERSVALRDAVRHGWDAAAVQAALLGDQPTLW